MKWKNIKKAGLTTKEIAKKLKYSNANSFRNSSKYKLIMDLLDESIGIMRDNPGSFPVQLFELEKKTKGLIHKKQEVDRKLMQWANES